MTVNGQASNFSKQDLIEVGEKFDVPRPKAIIDKTIDVFADWPTLAQKWNVPPEQIKLVSSMHRLFD